jgi:multidrug resistance protein EbrA
MNTTILSNMEKNKNAVIAGVLFALGNLFWIYSISTKTSIGSIRTIMAGFETALLFLVGYFLFSETFDVKKIIGIIMVLLGIYLIG